MDISKDTSAQYSGQSNVKLTAPGWHWSMARGLRDSAYLLLSWPVMMSSFVGVLTLLSVALPTVPLVIGVPLAGAGLGLARLMGNVERSLQSHLLNHDIQTGNPPRGSVVEEGSSFQRFLAAFRDPRRAGELALAGLGWLPATFIWSFFFAWVVTTVALLSAPLWVPLARGSDQGRVNDIASLLHLPNTPVAHGVANFVAGVTMCALTPWVARGLAVVQATICSFLLEAPVRPLQATLAEREQRRRLQAAQEAESGALAKLERDIHDGPQQRLVRLQMDIARAERFADDPAKSKEILAGARSQAQDALTELRATTRGVAPVVLTERGLAAACEEIAGRCPMPMHVDVEMRRLSAPEETALYYVVSEAVTNAIKHSHAREIRVTGRVQGGRATMKVVDDGTGGASLAGGSGLVGIERRMISAGGSLAVSSPAGGPTVIEGSLPCKS